MIDADEDGAAKLYHNGSTRFETESGGAKVGGNDGVALTIDCPNDYSNSSSLFMARGRGEIRSTIDASGGNPGGTMSIRTRNTAGSLVESIRIENGQQVLINSVAGTHPLRVSNGGVERFRVASTGNVGVGTITPTGNFEVSGNDGLTVSNATRSGTNGAQWRLIPHNGGGSATNLRLYEGAGSTEVLNITKTGRIGVNRLTPSYMLDIVGNSSTGANAIRIVDGSESGHGSHPSKIVAGGTYYQEMQMHGRRFAVHTYDGSSIEERLRVMQSGFVGINETSPGAQLTVKRASTSTSGLLGVLKLKQGNATNGNRASLLFSSLDDYDVAAVNGVIETHAGTASNNEGRLEFWTKHSGSAIAIRGSFDSEGSFFNYSDQHGIYTETSLGAGNSKYLYRGSNSSGSNIVFNVWSDGDVESATGSYGTVSDLKLKENIVNAGSQWNDFKSVQFRKFNFKEETGFETYTQLGVIAQELEAISPGLIYETPDTDREGKELGTTTKKVKTSVLTMKALVALQEAMNRIETLEAEVAALRG